jgi:hypothetical protein
VQRLACFDSRPLDLWLSFCHSLCQMASASTGLCFELGFLPVLLPTVVLIVAGALL